MGFLNLFLYLENNLVIFQFIAMAVDLRKRYLPILSGKKRRHPVIEEEEEEEEKITLSFDQKRALELVLSGKSVFLSGAAGTGKSFLTRVIVNYLEKELNKKVVIAASTGVASSLIKGVTLHSLLKLQPIEEQDIQQTFESRYDLDVTKPYWNKNDSRVNPFLFKTKDKTHTHTQSYTIIENDPFLFLSLFQQEQERTDDMRTDDIPRKKDPEYYKKKQLFETDREIWNNIDVLVIDEISMVSKNLFTALDLVARVTRGYFNRQRVNLPFGGIQMILVGDFYQLPPVNADFSFNSPSWNEIEPIFLEYQHRQEQDIDLSRILELIRQNVFAYPTVFKDEIRFVLDRLRSRTNQNENENGKRSLVTLFATNNQAQAENTRRQLMLKGICFENNHIYQEFYFSTIETIVNGKSTNVNSLLLSTGTQVMCTRNILLEDGNKIHNGMIGLVLGFVENQNQVMFLNKENIQLAKMTAHNWNQGNKMLPVVVFKGIERKLIIPGVETDEYERKGSRTVLKKISIELPLIPAWAITIHKSQGLTFDCIKLNLAETFVSNQIYVALSRAKSLDGIFIIGEIPKISNVAWTINRDVIQWTSTQKQNQEERQNREQQNILDLKSLII